MKLGAWPRRVCCELLWLTGAGFCSRESSGGSKRASGGRSTRESIRRMTTTPTRIVQFSLVVGILGPFSSNLTSVVSHTIQYNIPCRPMPLGPCSISFQLVNAVRSQAALDTGGQSLDIDLSLIQGRRRWRGHIVANTYGTRFGALTLSLINVPSEGPVFRLRLVPLKRRVGVGFGVGVIY